MQPFVTIEVDGTPIQCELGRPLLNAILNAGLVIETACGGQGTCHLCRVSVVEAALPPPNNIEKRALGNVLLAQGMRLSCQIVVEEGMRIGIPRRQRRRRKGKKGSR